MIGKTSRLIGLKTALTFLVIAAVAVIQIPVPAAEQQTSPQQGASRQQQDRQKRGQKKQGGGDRKQRESRSPAAERERRPPSGPTACNADFLATQILGPPTDRSVTVNVIPTKNLEIYFKYGPAAAIDLADRYEWGGKNNRGARELDKMRPGWELPIHPLMARSGVSIFFHGHDHSFVRQELDGVVCQELPEPADADYVAYNEEAYESGVKLPKAGHLLITVSPNQAKVDYIRSYLPKDETDGRKSGEIAYSYTVAPRRSSK